MSKYYVDFYDAFDGWGTWGFYAERLFDDAEDAKRCALELQATLADGNIKMGEHYAVISEHGGEIFCLWSMRIKPEAVQWFRAGKPDDEPYELRS